MENKSSYQINEQGVLGEVKIADDVIAVIAGIAATEVTGVARMCGNITNELVSKLGVNNLSKGVKVVVENHHVRVNLALELATGAVTLTTPGMACIFTLMRSIWVRSLRVTR